MEKQNINIQGYDICEIAHDEWVLYVKGGNTYVGTFRKVARHAVKKLGFNIQEIEIAVKELLSNDHNVAHFGIYKGFIFTSRKEIKLTRKAS